MPEEDPVWVLARVPRVLVVWQCSPSEACMQKSGVRSAQGQLMDTVIAPLLRTSALPSTNISPGRSWTSARPDKKSRPGVSQVLKTAFKRVRHEEIDTASANSVATVSASCCRVQFRDSTSRVTRAKRVRRGAAARSAASRFYLCFNTNRSCKRLLRALS